MGILSKIKEVGLANTVKGSFRRLKYTKLQKEYGFDTWHLSPYELRKYAQAVVKYVNTHRESHDEVVDIGCGLGEVIRNIKTDNRYGYDLSKEVIECAKTLDKTGTIKWGVGSFDEFGSGRKVEYYITLGFMHGSTEDTWVEPYTKVAKDNDIRKFVVDVVRGGLDGAKELDFTKILPAEYHLVDTLGPFLGERYIEIYGKQ